RANMRGPEVFWDEQRRFLELLHLLEQEEYGGYPPAPVIQLAERLEVYLRLHYREDLSNETLAEAFHFHPNYLVRSMKEVYHCTPMAYLHRYRIDQAKLLLIKTDWSIAQIADDVGFHFAPYFTNCFKR